ncbi:unnamed protein product [Closterium sp. NIES-54]
MGCKLSASSTKGAVRTSFEASQSMAQGDRAALPVARLPALPDAPPYWPRAALPCPSRRLAGRAPPSPTCRVALLAAASPCPAHTPPCSPPRRPALPACRPALPALRPALPAHRTAGSHAAMLCAALLPALLRTALLAPALQVRRPAARAPPCWPPHRPALPARRRAGRRPALAARRSSLAFDKWLDDLQLYLLSDYRDNFSLFDHTSGASLAPPATADSATRSQWLIRDAAARLAVRNHLPFAERAHFGQHKTAKALYDAVVARYSSPATTALDRLILPYLFPELSAFATVEDLITHLRTSETHYHTALPTEFLDRNPLPMYITLYFIVTHLPDCLRAVPLVALLAHPSLRGVPPPPLPPPTLLLLLLTSLVLRTSGLLLLLVGSIAAARERVERVVAVAAGVVVVEAVEAVEVVEVAVGVVAGVGASVAVVVAAVGVVVAVVAAVGVVEAAVVAVGVELFRGEVLAVARGNSSSIRARPIRPSSFLLRSGVDTFALDYDAILAAMYAVSVNAEGDYYLCVPPDPGIKALALGGSEYALLGTPPAEALHTFTIDSGAFRCFFRDSTTLTPLPALVPVRLADSLGGPVLARSSTVLPCPAVPSGSLSGLHLPSFSTNLVSTTAVQDAMVTTTTHGGQRVSICTCTRTCRHLATFTRRPGSSPYTLTTKPTQVAASGQVSASNLIQTPLLVSPPIAPDSLLAPPPWSPLPATPSWHALTPPCFWSSKVSASPPALACPALPSLRRGAAARRSSLLVSPNEYSPAESPHGLCLQLRERFCEDLRVMRLHSDGGGEFSSDLLRDFCRGEGILQSFTLPASLQQNGVAERRIGLVMEVARISMIHAAAPHFLWPFAGPAPSGVSQVDPLPLAEPVEVTVDSGAARGAASGGAEPASAERGVAELASAEPGGAEPKGAEPGGADSKGPESGGAEPRGTATAAGPTGASPRLSHQREPLSPQQLREWFAQRTRLRSGAVGAGGPAARGAGAGGVRRMNENE